MKNESEIKQNVLLNIDEVVKILSKDGTVEIKNSKDGISIFDISKKKVKTIK